MPNAVGATPIWVSTLNIVKFKCLLVVSLDTFHTCCYDHSGMSSVKKLIVPV